MSSRDPRPVIIAFACLALAAPGSGVRSPVHAQGQRSSAQAPPAPQTGPATDTSTGAITGVVVDDAGTPVPEAVVSLWNRVNRATLPAGRQFSDELGRFAFVNLAASDAYFVSASRPGFRDGAMGEPSEREDRGARIMLGSGEWYGKARIRLARLGAVTGTVVDDRGDPLVGAYVRAIGRVTVAGRSFLVVGPHTTTDDRGWYRLADLSPGAYAIQVPSVTGSAPAELTTTALAGGSPQALARYQALGQTPPVEMTTTIDEAWQVRLGRYVTPPAPVDGRWRAFPITFFPGTTDVAQATVLQVSANQERVADFRVMPVLTGRVTGTVQGPAESLVNLSLRLVPAGLEDLGLGSETATALVRSDGSFAFVGVPAGSYAIDAPRTVTEINSSFFGVNTIPTNFALPPPMGASDGFGLWMPADSAAPGTAWYVVDARTGAGAFWGRTPLVTDGSDVSGVVVTMHQMASVSGEVLVDVDLAQPTAVRPTSAFIRIDPADGDPRLGRPMASARQSAGAISFSLAEAMPGEYFLRASSGPSWVLKSIFWKGRDISDVPIDLAAVRQVTDLTVTLTNAVPTLAGTVQNERGGPAESVAVIAFPVSPTGWTRYGLVPRTIKTAATSTIGAFEFKTLPAGDFYVVAVPASQRNAWQDPAFLQRMSAVATRVQLSWGETTMQNLRLVGEVR